MGNVNEERSTRLCQCQSNKFRLHLTRRSTRTESLDDDDPFIGVSSQQNARTAQDMYKLRVVPIKGRRIFRLLWDC